MKGDEFIFRSESMQDYLQIVIFLYPNPFNRKKYHWKGKG